MVELDRLSVTAFKEATKTPIALVLDNVRSALNVGSIFRTADAFRLMKIVLVGITAKPPNREINKTALGATDTVEWQYCETIIQAVDQLTIEKYQLIGIEQTKGSIPLQKFTPLYEQPLALFFGNEVDGLSEEVLPHLKQCIEIPQVGMKHSLNISVSAGIVCWDLFAKYSYSQ